MLSAQTSKRYREKQRAAKAKKAADAAEADLQRAEQAEAAERQRVEEELQRAGQAKAAAEAERDRALMEAKAARDAAAVAVASAERVACGPQRTTEDAHARRALSWAMPVSYAYTKKYNTIQHTYNRSP